MNDEKISPARVQDQLLDFVSTQFVFPKEEIDPNISLVQAGIIDSIGLIEITSFMEQSYGLTILEAEMTRDNFGSIFRMARFVCNRMAG